jgi:hypothetical protein
MQPLQNPSLWRSSTWLSIPKDKKMSSGGTCIQSVILILKGSAREDCQLVLRDSNVKKGLLPLLPPHSGTCCRGKISSLENWRGRNLVLVWLVAELDGNEREKLHMIHQICLFCHKPYVLYSLDGQTAAGDFSIFF